MGVLLFATTTDAHADVVGAALCDAGVRMSRIAFDTVADAPLALRPGKAAEFRKAIVTDGWTVWWRRAGHVPADEGLAAAEDLLRREETEFLVLGGLLSIPVRWVDEPFAVLRAERTLAQLAVAARLGLPTPETVVTNDPSVAETLIAAGPVVAKATSPGVGLAPFVDAVGLDQVDLLPAGPTLLQRQIPAAADARVVIIEESAWVWCRERNTGEIDWRRTDPTGAGFSRSEWPELSHRAVAVTQALHLSTSVQDWVVDETGQPWFLEANPAGAWLFLADAEKVIVPAMAAHLAGRPL